MRRPCLLALLLVVAAAGARAAPPEPTGPHPRLLLDDELRAAWQAQLRAGRGPVVGAVATCEAAQGPAFDRGLYQGAQWARALQACLVAWAATADDVHATTAIKFMTALLRDRDVRGDGQGGDTAARRDSGYAIRNHGPYTALAYDWLHGHPALTPALREEARRRWAAWLGWYRAEGYRARAPGTNYQAGFLAAATLIAIAQGGEAVAEGGPALWAFVADELWGRDMVTALGAGGILDGGDWPEGWQYGPLAVAHYALAARVARAHGIAAPGIDAWLASVLRRHVHGLSPGERVHVGQDTEVEQPTIAPHALTLAAVALGDAPADERRWARGELARLGMVDKEFLLYAALASVGERPAAPPRAAWPTWYLARATGTLFARTRWDPRAVWLVGECQGALDVDHRHPKAGNFVLSRGADDVIVDPSPYGAVSSRTSNAPTVRSGHLPRSYQPSQGVWGTDVGWAWTTQTRSGVVAARCDYADAYRFQHRASDVPEATRDLVLVPGPDGTEAALVVVDRARTGARARGLDLRFRVAGGLALAGEVATKVVGDTRLTIASPRRSGGALVIGRPAGRRCLDPAQKGACDAARFDASDLRLDVPGPAPAAVTALAVHAAAAPAPPPPAPRGGPGWEGIELAWPRPATILWPTGRDGLLRYRARPGTHVILGAPHLAGTARATAAPDGDACADALRAGGPLPARPAVLVVDGACRIASDPAADAPTLAPPPPRGPAPRAGFARHGCCSAHGGSAGALGLAALGLAVLARGRRARAA